MMTVDKISVGEFEEKKSRFIGFLLPYPLFGDKLALLRKEHPKANHFITAFRYLNDQEQIVEGSRDDGEPSGTSGPPVLKTLQGNDLINVGAIIIRYFGGTKLGKGGLSRAYAGGIKLAIDNAKIIHWVKTIQEDVQVTFSDMNKFETLCGQLSLEIITRNFNECGASIKISGSETAVNEAIQLIQPY